MIETKRGSGDARKWDDGTEPEIKVRPDLYELPHLFGFWLQDPYTVRQEEKAENIKVWPDVLLFLGPQIQIELFMEQDDDDPEARQVTVVESRYRVGKASEPGTMYFERIGVNDKGEPEIGPEQKLNWAFLKSGRFAEFISGDVWLYVPASVDDIVAAGYPRELIESSIGKWVEAGWDYIETFNEEAAEKFKAQYWQETEEDLR